MTTIRFSRTLAMLSCSGWLFQACSGEPQKVQRPTYIPPGATSLRPDAGAVRTPIACKVHADCYSMNGFCDQGFCSYWPAAPYGEVCTVDADCQSQFCHGGRCAVRPMPNGELCGADASCQSGFCDLGSCAVLDTTKLPNGKACSADAQCQMGLCDRGVCTRKVFWRSYGALCAAPPGTPIKEIPQGSHCFGYLCLDGRCRSCESDSECLPVQRAAGGTPSEKPWTCRKFNDWPGKQCGQVIQGQVCPNGNPPAPRHWPHEGPEIVSMAPLTPLPDGAPLLPSRPEIDCRTWPDM